MGLAQILAAVSLAPAALAIVLRPYVPRIVCFTLWHAAGVTACVGVASFDTWADKTTGLLGKSKDGYFPPASLLVFWPYHVGLRVKLVFRRRSSEELISNPLPGWYLGGWPASADMLPPGNLSVVDVTCELPRSHTKPYLCLPTWDTQGPTVELIQRGVDWMLSERAKGQAVLVHCAHGHGRSCAVLCAALLTSGEAQNVQDALRILKSARPRVRLNKYQAAALQAWLEHKKQST